MLRTDQGRHTITASLQNAEQLCAHEFRPGKVRFVDDEDIGGFHDAGFHRLDVVAGTRSEHEKLDIGERANSILGLSDAYGFDEHFVESKAIQRCQHFHDVVGQSIVRMPARERADVHARVLRQCFHANAIAEHRAL